MQKRPDFQNKKSGNATKKAGAFVCSLFYTQFLFVYFLHIAYFYSS